jgi:hypothetical protein
VHFESDCRTPEQVNKLLETWKGDEVFRDMVTMSEKADKMGGNE